jgi:hypothetical protein
MLSNEHQFVLFNKFINVLFDKLMLSYKHSLIFFDKFMNVHIFVLSQKHTFSLGININY